MKKSASENAKKLTRKNKMRSRIALVSLNLEGYLSLSCQVLRACALSEEVVARRCSIEVLDYDLEYSKDDIISKLRRFDVICFATYMWNIRHVRLLAQKLKNKYIVLGGPEVSARPRFYLNKSSTRTTVIAGEGEKTFSLFLRDYLKAKPRRLYKAHNSQGSLCPIPVYSTSYFRRYLNKKRLASRKHFNLVFETMRGCPHSCSYCTWGKKKLEKHPIDYLKRELSSIMDFKGIKILYCSDSNICIDKERAKEIIEYINRLNSHSTVRHIYYEFDGASIDDDIARCFARNERNLCSFGVQTTNPNVLRIISRPFNLSLFRRNVKQFKKAGNHLCFDVIIGLPADTKESFLKTVNDLLFFDPDHINFFPLYVLPASDVCKYARKYRIVHQKTPPYKTISSLAMGNLTSIEHLCVWMQILLMHDTVRQRLGKMSRSNKIHIYADFIKYLMLDPALKSIRTSLDYRWRTPIDKYFNRSFENRLLRHLSAFARIERGDRPAN